MRTRGSAIVLACAGAAPMLGVVAPFAAIRAPSFGRATDHETGREPGAIAVGDLNGDRNG